MEVDLSSPHPPLTPPPPPSTPHPLFSKKLYSFCGRQASLNHSVSMDNLTESERIMSSLPILMQNHSGGDSVALGIIPAELQALAYDILPSTEGAGKRCSECELQPHPLLPPPLTHLREISLWDLAHDIQITPCCPILRSAVFLLF